MTKKWILALMAVLLAAAPAWSATAAKKTPVMRGILVDNACAKSHPSDLAEYLKSHDKACALKPESQASGYSILTAEGKLTPFTKKSTPMIVAFLKQEGSRLEVEVAYKRAFKYLKLVSIQNLP